MFKKTYLWLSVAWLAIPLYAAPEYVAVPGVAPQSGEVWYQCFVKVPDSWTNLEGRPLWYESVTLQVNELAGAHEVFVNEQRIGGAGVFPPVYQDGRATVTRYKVPPGLLKKGVYNSISIRSYLLDGEGGFHGPPPILSGYFLEAKLTGDWKMVRSKKPEGELTPLPKKPERVGFDQFSAAASVLKRPDQLFAGARLTPQESLATFTINDPNFELELLLSEPQIAQPLQMTFDERGRMWLVEYRQYPYPAGLDVVSRDRFYRSIYNRVPPPPPHHTPGADRVSIHEDTNGDGLFDSHKVFVDQLNMVTAVAPGGGGVWMLNAPYLLFWPDANQDDLPDGDPEVHLVGFGMQDTHSLVNSLRWGPDGWLYACHGSTTSSTITGHNGKPAYIEGPAVWRYHPARKTFEFFGIGGGNLFSLEFDSDGQVFSGYNGGNTRGFHFRQGAYYTKGGRGKYGPPANLYAYGQLEPMAHADVPRFTHSFAIYEGHALSAEYHQNLFCIDPLHRRVVRAAREKNGSTFRTRDLGFTLECADPAFRPVDIKVGPDGAMYIADFYEYYIAHGQHFQGQIDPSSGRVYRLRPKSLKTKKSEDLRTASAERLLELLEKGDRWHRETALRMIAERRLGDAPALRALVTERGSLPALWALHQLGLLDTAFASECLSHEAPAIRAWAVRLLAEPGVLELDALKAMLEITPRDPEEFVQWASVIQRLPANQARALLRQLLRSPPPVDDPQVPHMLWWAIEKHVDDDPQAMVDVIANANVSKGLLERLARRLVAPGKQRGLDACVQLVKAMDEPVQKAAVKEGLVIEVRARPELRLPVELMEMLADEPEIAQLLALRTGDNEVLTKAIDRVVDRKTPLPERKKLLQQLAELNDPLVYAPMLGLARDPAQPLELRKQTMPILAALGGVAAPEGFLPDLSASFRLLLMSRGSWASDWLNEEVPGPYPTAVFSEMEASVLRAHEDVALNDLIQSKVGSAPKLNTRIETDRLLEVINAGSGDPYSGREVYRNLCGSCHQLFQMGGSIGPNLTGYPREDLSLMLFHVVDPSAEIREGYGVHLVKTKDKRVRFGFIEDESAGMLVLVDMEGQRHRILREQVVEQRVLPHSLMPPGLLQVLPEQSLRDLIAYLRAGQPMVRD